MNRPPFFTNGSAVTLTDAYGNAHTGTLHLPDVRYFLAGGGQTTERQTTRGEYGVYTLILSDGSRFRTEGRLS